MKKGKILLGIALCSTIFFGSSSVNAESVTYNVGDTVYFNPITAHLCTNGENDCLEWNVFENGESILKLQAKESIGSTVLATAEKKTLTGCFVDGIYNNGEYYNTESRCTIMSAYDNTEWKENFEVDTFDNINALKSFLKTKTNSWSDKLVLKGIYDEDDLTGYKARVFSLTEVNAILRADGTGVGNSIYDFLKDDKFLNQTKKYLTLTIDNCYKISVLASGIQYPENNSIGIGTSQISTRSSSDVYPLIEINKKYLETYNITKIDNSDDYFTIDNNNPNVGDKVILKTNLKKGYEIDKIIVSTETGENVEVNDLSFIMPEKNVKISIIYKPLVYKFTEGKDASYNDTDLTFKLDGLLELLDKVYVNGELLSSDNYTTKSGSTIITLKDEYLKTLDVGTYNLKVTYKTGVEDTTTFKINEKITDKVIDDVKEENPKTDDYILLYVTLGVISLISLFGTTLYIKKRFN